MKKEEKQLLFQKAYERLKLAMHTAEAIKQGSDDEAMARRLASLTSDALIAANTYSTAMATTASTAGT